MIKAVIFDFFGVLVTEGFKQFLDDYFPDDAAKRRRAVDLINRVDSGDMKMHEFRSELAVLARITAPEVDHALGGNKPNKPLLEYIRQNLKNRYKLGILSNSSMDYPRKLLDRRDVDMFNDIILSYRLGMVKPDPGIYKLACDRLDIEADQCVFVDDSMGHVVGAEAVGMKAIYYETFHQMGKELAKILSAESDK